MGCSNCGSANGGKPNGCKSNGGCSTGGCNRMNSYDWLRNLPIADTDSSCNVIELSFNHGSRKDYFRNPTLQQFEKGDLLCVEGVSGFDLGEVSLTGEIVRLQMKKKNVKEDNPEMKKVLRYATDRDLEIWKQNKAREPDRKSTRLNSSHGYISYAGFCLKKKKSGPGSRRHRGRCRQSCRAVCASPGRGPRPSHPRPCGRAPPTPAATVPSLPTTRAGGPA